jgi:hypothetical protein
LQEEQRMQMLPRGVEMKHRSTSRGALHQLSLGAVTVVAGLALCPETSRADESGISFWLPGQDGSLAATPTTPGWAVATIYYHTTIDASGAAAASREFQVGKFPVNANINLNLSLSGRADLMIVAPTYTFATPVLGGQLSATLAGIYGRSDASIAGTLTAAAGQLVTTSMGALGDALTSYGDLFPTLKLKWNSGVNNYMVYAAGDIPVGVYDPNQLANIGLGHGAIDLGGGYTYLNPISGNEFSRRRPTDRLYLPGRRHAGLSWFEGIRRIRRGQPAIGMELVADVLAFRGRSQSCDADHAPRNEVVFSFIWMHAGAAA